MEFETRYISPDIKLSEFSGRSHKTETMFEEHILVWFISGETRIVQANRTHRFGAGDVFLIPRNQPATIVNLPKGGKPNKAVAMHLTRKRLQEYYSRYKPHQQGRPLKSLYRFKSHTVLQDYFSSLLSYFESKGKLSAPVSSLKIEEAISLLRTADPGIDAALADFDDPGKIDLIGFMEKNYMFNLKLERFGYLTGRSLSTFRRDFEKSFGMKPQEWLTGKRLDLAHYQIAGKGRKPSEVYLEAGFENLSHFSFVFRKKFGYSASEL